MTIIPMQQETCHYRKEASGIAMSGVVNLPPGNEKELLAAVATVGPVSVSVDGSSNAFRVCIINKATILSNAYLCKTLLSIKYEVEKIGYNSYTTSQ